MFICVCNAISDREIRACADLGVGTLEELRSAIGVASCCGQCAGSARQILVEHQSGKHEAAELASA